MDKHTPTPWILDGDWILKDDDTPVAAAHVNAEANAAYIVRACNAHERLVEALKEARDLLALNGIDINDSADYGNGRADDIVRRIGVALGAAEAK